MPMSGHPGNGRLYHRDMSELPGLRLLLSGYLHLDWPEDYGSDLWAAVDDFATSEPEAAEGLAAEIESVLTDYGSEDELRRLVFELGSGYLPEADGYEYRSWLQQVAQRVAGTLGG